CRIREALPPAFRGSLSPKAFRPGSHAGLDPKPRSRSEGQIRHDRKLNHPPARYRKGCTRGSRKEEGRQEEDGQEEGRKEEDGQEEDREEEGSEEEGQQEEGWK